MSIARIRQILETWEQNISQDTNLPLELVSLTIELLQTLYPRHVLRQLPDEDLIAWVIALNITIETQVKVLNTWEPTLRELLLQSAPKLAEKNRKLNLELNQSNRNITPGESIISLLRQRDEIRDLQTQERRLRELQAEISTTNIPELRQRVNTLQQANQSQSTTLQELREQKALLITLQQQQQAIASETENLTSQNQHISSQLIQDINQLTLVIKEQGQHLETTLQSANLELEQEQQNYQQKQQELEQVIERSNDYQLRMDKILRNLNSQYNADSKLGEIILQNNTSIEAKIQAIETSLSELEKELEEGRQTIEKTSPPQKIFF